MEKLKQTLTKVKNFEFVSKSLLNSKTNWNLKGLGKSSIKLNKNCIFIKNELFIKENNLCFKDEVLYKFTKNNLMFYRFQHGKYKLIFNFINKQQGKFLPKNPYTCKNDTYNACITCSKNILIIEFFIKSLRKNEHITYSYNLTK